MNDQPWKEFNCQCFKYRDRIERRRIDPMIPELALQMPVLQRPGSRLRVLDIYGIGKTFIDSITPQYGGVTFS